jgi:hypothetical protein
MLQALRGFVMDGWKEPMILARRAFIRALRRDSSI